MSALDCIKAAIMLIGYFGIAPALGLWMRDHRQRQRWMFGLLVFMTSWQINKLTLMVDSIELYRGATKGFEYSWMIVVALGLLLSEALSRGPKRRWIAPGLALYLLYVAASWVSIFAAPNKVYVWMAAFRFIQPAVIYLAAFHFFRDADDLRILMKSVSATLCIQALVVVKLKYLNHIYQVWGWFEHQNALAMWAYMCSLPLLAMALGPASKKDARWCWAGYFASAIIIESALARASLVAFAIGTFAVIVLSLCDRVTMRRLVAPAVMGLVGMIGLAFTLKTIMFRFSEDRNQSSSELRILLIQASKLMLHDSAIGLGWNNYALVINKPWSYGDCIDQWQIDRGNTLDPDELKPQPESHYWLLLAENGWPGFVSYLLFIGVTTWWCLLAAWRYRGTLLGAFLMGLLVALVLTYLHSTIERCLTQTKNLAMWLIFLGFIARLKLPPPALAAMMRSRVKRRREKRIAALPEPAGEPVMS